MSSHRSSGLVITAAWLGSVLGAAILLPSAANAQQQQLAQTTALRQTVFLPTLSIRELFTDNVALTDTNTSSDFVTTATAGLTVTRLSPRIQLYLNGTASYDKYADRTDLDGFRPSLLGVATAEILENRLFLDTRASVVERAVRRTTPGPAVARTSPTDQTRILNFSVTPQLVHDFDGYVQTQVVLSYAGTQFGKTDVGTNASKVKDTNDFKASTTVSSSWRASRVRWQLDGSFLKSSNKNQQTSVDGVLEYALSQGLIPFVRAGYDDVKDRFLNNKKRSGGIYSAGLSWVPGPRLSFKGEIGHRFGGLSGAASVKYAITSALNIAINYSEGIATQQQALTNALGLLEFANAGTQIGSSSAPVLVDSVGSPVQISNNTLSLNDSSFKSQNLSVGINGTIRKTALFIRAYRITRKFDANATTPALDETVAGVSSQISRKLSNGIAVNLAGTYSTTLNPRTPPEDDTQVTGRASLSYAINKALSTSIGYDYRNLQTKVGDSIENAVTAYINITF